MGRVAQDSETGQIGLAGHSLASFFAACSRAPDGTTAAPLKPALGTDSGRAIAPEHAGRKPRPQDNAETGLASFC